MVIHSRIQNEWELKSIYIYISTLISLDLASRYLILSRSPLWMWTEWQRERPHPNHLLLLQITTPVLPSLLHTRTHPLVLQNICQSYRWVWSSELCTLVCCWWYRKGIFSACIANLYVYFHHYVYSRQQFRYQEVEITLMLYFCLTEGCDIFYNKWTPDSAFWCTIKSSPTLTTFRCIIQPQDSDNALWGWVRSPHTCTKCVCKCPATTFCYTSLEQLPLFV